MEILSKCHRTCNNMDKFSSLPDHIVHKITSYLSLKDISRLSVVSRRCRQVCISSPFLVFDLIPYSNNQPKRVRLINYIDRLLFLRNGKNIEWCYISWCMQSSLVNEEEYRILSWLHNAVACNAKMLNLQLNLRRESYFALPTSLLSSTSLTALEVNLHNGAILKIPSSSTAITSLKYLTLNSLRIDKSFGDWVLSCCKSLMVLSLVKIDGTKSINITSSSLKALMVVCPRNLFNLQVCAETLESMILHWTFSNPDNRVLQLSAPKLGTFVWNGKISEVQLEANFMCLNFAGILVTPSSSTDQNLVHLLRALRKVRDLHISYNCLQGGLPILFTSMSTIVIYNVGDAWDDLLPTIISLFEAAPNLICLSVKNKCFPFQYPHNFPSKEESDCGRSMLCSESENIPFMHNLRFVRIELALRRWNVLELIKYLLKNTKNLQKMTIICDPLSFSDVRREISGYEKASSEAEVEFYSL
ncbi:F-box/LRR-repeat protein At3g58900 [Morus notabilis]|uniref:F-box/LRR-repeat protein At3g58900 n=1 Tax=Morus notabilis TaxID=981085 RepID=UPI000CED4095|nr:F-box/LRR-repeat protein At3g58900 [Morus notabilis]